MAATATTAVRSCIASGIGGGGRGSDDGDPARRTGQSEGEDVAARGAGVLRLLIARCMKVAWCAIAYSSDVRWPA